MYSNPSKSALRLASVVTLVLRGNGAEVRGGGQAHLKLKDLKETKASAAAPHPPGSIGFAFGSAKPAVVLRGLPKLCRMKAVKDR